MRCRRAPRRETVAAGCRAGAQNDRMTISYEWRGDFENREVNALHAEAFDTRVFSDQEWDWVQQVEQHSFCWVCARRHGALVGFVNVLWDGLVHAWLQDVMVAASDRHQGVGVALVRCARDRAFDEGCEFLHVDFAPHLAPFYFDACGFSPTSAGLIRLR